MSEAQDIAQALAKLSSDQLRAVLAKSKTIRRGRPREKVTKALHLIRGEFLDHLSDRAAAIEIAHAARGARVPRDYSERAAADARLRPRIRARLAELGCLDDVQSWHQVRPKLRDSRRRADKGG